MICQKDFIRSTLMHGDLKIGDSVFMLTEESTEMKTLSPESIGGSQVSMYLYVRDVDHVFNQAGYLRSIWSSLVSSNSQRRSFAGGT